MGPAQKTSPPLVALTPRGEFWDKGLESVWAGEVSVETFCFGDERKPVWPDKKKVKKKLLKKKEKSLRSCMGPGKNLPGHTPSTRPLGLEGHQC